MFWCSIVGFFFSFLFFYFMMLTQAESFKITNLCLYVVFFNLELKAIILSLVPLKFIDFFELLVL